MQGMFVIELVFLAVGLLLGCAMKQYMLAGSTALCIILLELQPQRFVYLGEHSTCIRPNPTLPYPTRFARGQDYPSRKERSGAHNTRDREGKGLKATPLVRGRAYPSRKERSGAHNARDREGRDKRQLTSIGDANSVREGSTAQLTGMVSITAGTTKNDSAAHLAVELFCLLVKGKQCELILAG